MQRRIDSHPMPIFWEMLLLLFLFVSVGRWAFRCTRSKIAFCYIERKNHSTISTHILFCFPRSPRWPPWSSSWTPTPRWGSQSCSTSSSNNNSNRPSPTTTTTWLTWLSRQRPPTSGDTTPPLRPPPPPSTS